MGFVLGCGCIAWSKEQQHLIKVWCAKHLREIEERNHRMRLENLERQRTRAELRYSPEQILANLERMKD
jgi:hypothetical protein